MTPARRANGLRAVARTAPLALALLASGCQRPPPGRIALAFHVAAAEAREGFRAVPDEHGRTLYLAPHPVVTEKDVRTAAVLTSRRRAVVQLELDDFAALRLQSATTRHAGERLAVLVDDAVLVSMPIVAPITHRLVYLHCDLTREQATDIVRRLSVPAAPPPDAAAWAPSG